MSKKIKLPELLRSIAKAIEESPPKSIFIVKSNPLDDEGYFFVYWPKNLEQRLTRHE